LILVGKWYEPSFGGKEPSFEGKEPSFGGKERSFGGKERSSWIQHRQVNEFLMGFPVWLFVFAPFAPFCGNSNWVF
jgi:hypothetical protein